MSVNAKSQFSKILYFQKRVGEFRKRRPISKHYGEARSGKEVMRKNSHFIRKINYSAFSMGWVIPIPGDRSLAIYPREKGSEGNKLWGMCGRSMQIMMDPGGRDYTKSGGEESPAGRRE